MQQLDMFPVEGTKEEKQDVEYMKCHVCGEEKAWNLDNFSFNTRELTGKVYLKKTCKSCNSSQVQFVKFLRKKHKHEKTDTCDCCGATNKKLVLDHCHATNKFRGWVCYNCNTGLAQLGDNKEGLLLALAYIERTEQKDET